MSVANERESAREVGVPRTELMMRRFADARVARELVNDRALPNSIPKSPTTNEQKTYLERGGGGGSGSKTGMLLKNERVGQGEKSYCRTAAA